MEEQQQNNNPRPQLGMAYDYSSLTKELFDTTELITRLELNLRGYIWDGEKYVQKRPPYLNERGLGVVITLVGSIVNKDTSMTDLSEAQILTLLQSFHCELAENLGYNMFEYNIDEVDYSIIISIVMGMIQIALNKTKEGALIELLKLTNRDVHQYTVKESSKGGGFFSNILPFGKKD